MKGKKNIDASITGKMLSRASVKAQAPATEVAMIIAGFIKAVAEAAATAPIIAPITSVTTSVPKYWITINITRKKQIPATQSFSIEKPSIASTIPPAIGSKVWYKESPAICGTAPLIIGIKTSMIL